MAHRADIEANSRIEIDRRTITDQPDLVAYQAAIVLLPPLTATDRRGPWAPAAMSESRLGRIAALAAGLRIASPVTLALCGEPQAIIAAHPYLSRALRFHRWIAARTADPVTDGLGLPAAHTGIALYGTELRLRHTKVRLPYSLCPACGDTTKDYGGKRHVRGTDYGTLMSDVWRDVAVPAVGLGAETESRLIDLLRTPEIKRILILDATDPSELPASLDEATIAAVLPPVQPSLRVVPPSIDPAESRIVTGDCLALLPRLPDASVDLVFLDPPYNLDKAYASYADDLAVEDYFRWCDRWIEQAVRVLKPGGSLVIINLPLWSIRHALYLNQRLTFRNWIAWDALSQPRGYIMPAHYPLLWYTKGDPRPIRQGATTGDESGPLLARPDGLCLRPRCVNRRGGRFPGSPLTDLWTDIARVMHRSRRLDHPCLLPPKLMQRLISLLTDAGDVVADPFNGVGTTSLVADQLERRYIGLELDPEYAEVARTRHLWVQAGHDPFEIGSRTRRERTLSVSKKALQLEVLRVARILGHLPTKSELAAHSAHSLDLYERTFDRWYEVTAAAKKAGYEPAA